MSSFREAVYQVVRKIPSGRLMTYGQIARYIGTPRASRAVAGALHKNPKPDAIPCHRVIHCDGRLARGFAFGGIQAHAKKLKKEGFRIENNRIKNFEQYIIQISE